MFKAFGFVADATQVKKMFVLFRIICSRCCTRRNLRFHVENCLSFSQADPGPRSAHKLHFSRLLKSLKLIFRRFVLIASGTEIFRL